MIRRPDKLDENEDALARNSKGRSSFFEQLPAWLLSIPVTLAALGICYDVGFFARTGFDLLSLFSLSEHLAFGLQGVPDLLLVLTLFLVPAAIGYAVGRRIGEAGKPFPKEVFIGAFLGSVIGGGVQTIVLFPHLFWLFALQVVYIGVWLWLIWETRAGAEQRVVIFGGLAWGVVLLAFGLGYARASAPEGWRWSITPATISLTDDPSICGRVLRSGEHGLLMSNVIDGTIQFRSWDKIRGIEVEEVEPKPWWQAWWEIWSGSQITCK